MKNPMIYVAGPITGDPWGCVRRATETAEQLARFSFLAYLPQLSVLHEIVSHQPYEHWIEHGLAMVERCDGLVRLPGESLGADREVQHAIACRIPVLQAAFAGIGETESGIVNEWCASVRQAPE